MNKRTRSTPSQQSLLNRGIEFYCWCLDSFGTVPTVIGSALIVLAIFGGIQHFNADADRAEMLSSIPDGISQECYAKLQRTVYGETAEEHERKLAPERETPVDNCGDIGTVK